MIPWDTDGDIGITLKGLIRLYHLTANVSSDVPLFPCNDCILFFRWNKTEGVLQKVFDNDNNNDNHNHNRNKKYKA